MAHHEILATPENMLLGYLDAATPPVLHAESGDKVRLHSFLAGGRPSLTRNQAYMPCSLADSLRVTQLVDGNKGVHMLLDKPLL